MASVFSPEWVAYLQLFDTYEFQDIPPVSSKCCLIIEPRDHPHLRKLMKQFMYLLAPRGWGLVFAHGHLNEHAGDGIPHLHKIALGVDNLTISQYNAYITQSSLWKQLLDRGIQTVLVFQLDTLILHAEIEPFLVYDYVGAPWKRPYRGQHVGNGGLSLRNVQKMYTICQKYGATRRPRQNEDIFFSLYSKGLGYSVPSASVARAFSVETCYHHDPLGLHKPLLDQTLIQDLILQAHRRWEEKLRSAMTDSCTPTMIC